MVQLINEDNGSLLFDNGGQLIKVKASNLITDSEWSRRPVVTGSHHVSEKWCELAGQALCARPKSTYTLIDADRNEIHAELESVQLGQVVDGMRVFRVDPKTKTAWAEKGTIVFTAKQWKTNPPRVGERVGDGNIVAVSRRHQTATVRYS